MSHADNTATTRKSGAERQPPKGCNGCSGLLPRPQLVDLEDMDKIALETLIRKANIAQHMLKDLMKQLSSMQTSQSNLIGFNMLKGLNHKDCYI